MEVEGPILQKAFNLENETIKSEPQVYKRIKMML